jgi:hypothetical protein
VDVYAFWNGEVPYLEANLSWKAGERVECRVDDLHIEDCALFLSWSNAVGQKAGLVVTRLCHQGLGSDR